MKVVPFPPSVNNHHKEWIMKVEFKVAMDSEAAKAKDHQMVVLEVTACDAETMLKYALKAYVVELQSNIRSNWDEFLKGTYPTSVVIGESLFAKRTGVVTLEKATEKLAALPEKARFDALLKAGILTQDQYDALVG